MNLVIKKAQRKEIKIKLAVTGPTGSGKTYSALRMAKGLGSKVGFIDTENGSASLYSDKFDFDVIEISPPFTTEKYIEAIQAFVDAKYDVLVIDSLSHAWAGEGGVLAQKDSMDKRGGNSYTNWGTMTKKQDAFISAVLQSDIHIIATMRSKMSYELADDGKGKMKPQKLGLAPIQRDGVEYEYSIIFDVGMSHEAEVSKDRTGLFTDQIFKITEATGEKIKTWLQGAKVKTDTTKTTSADSKGASDTTRAAALQNSGDESLPESLTSAESESNESENIPVQVNGHEKISYKEASSVYATALKKGFNKDKTDALLFKNYGGVKSATELNYNQYETIMKNLESR